VAVTVDPRRDHLLAEHRAQELALLTKLRAEVRTGYPGSFHDTGPDTPETCAARLDALARELGPRRR
jgi:hypothetical protein